MKMKKIITLLMMAMLVVPLLSCSRTMQTESLTAPRNQNAFLAALKVAAAKLQFKPSDKLPIAYVLRESDGFSISGSGSLGKLLRNKISGLYPFKSENLSEHQKTMIDTFIKNSVFSDPSFSLTGDESAVRMVVVAYMKSYTYKKELYFDIFDCSNGDQVGRVQYEMSDVSYQFQLKQ
jgi:hypothetical protein